MATKYALTATLAALSLAAALSAQAQGFNDRTEISFGTASQAPREVTQPRLEGFNDRSEVSFKPGTARQNLGPRMVEAELGGFNDKSDA
ncbi:MAG: hypothetical protein R3310_11850 [Candidatus Competibacteraceae bacterium]|nr:hypothetical protein [Candidatus Competibacteraceae bacterium]